MRLDRRELIQSVRYEPYCFRNNYLTLQLLPLLCYAGRSDISHTAVSEQVIEAFSV